MSVLGALNEQRSSLKGIQKKARRRRSNWSLPAATLVPQPHHPPGARHCEHAGSIEQRHPSDREQAVLGQDARVRRHAAHPCTALVCLCSDATGHRAYPLHRGIESTLLVCLRLIESIASEQLRSEMPRGRAPAAAGGARRARACELYARGRANYGFGDEQEPECHASVLCGSAHQSDSLFLAALWVCARARVDPQIVTSHQSTRSLIPPYVRTAAGSVASTQFGAD